MIMQAGKLNPLGVISLSLFFFFILEVFVIYGVVTSM